ncbi:EAL domain-containing protein [Lichenibacterium ramalinae]|uniref:EAL domain-containing protein n=1 Tax=Lichenibacterium ramalinae TaxID=2316527 RepID=A0A4Q2R431_9HYPH|nr:EAL domain-containing protein [Lichenibacterium ramalinae]RYB01315.1 EAL domain-containing protein [Lichenibacterium ramalinae]
MVGVLLDAAADAALGDGKGDGHASHVGKLSLSRHRPESIGRHPRKVRKSHEIGVIPPTQILEILMAEVFQPSRLEVEVTESALVGDIAAAKQTLAALQAAGIKVALDDFGTGYSSLYHLREMKFDKLKIDRSFVQSMQGNPESQKIVEAVLGLAKSLDMPAVAEGIEDVETMRALALRGCTFGQGYLFSRAVPVADVARLLADERPTVIDLPMVNHAQLNVQSRCVMVQPTRHGGTRYGTGSPRLRHDD